MTSDKRFFKVLTLMWLAGALPLTAMGAGTDAQAKAGPAAESVAPQEYRIGPEDVLEISVWKEEGMKKEIVVRPDGGISFPLIDDIQASGKTAVQLQREVEQALEKFIPQPVVSVAVLKVVSNKVYVIGRVNRPGEFSAGRYIDVLQALAMAGGLSPFASQDHIKILRRDGGKETAIPFQYSRMEKGEALEQNVQLKGGDVVIVP